MSGRGWFFCGRRPCSLCGSPSLTAWTALHSFPTADSGSLPYALDGSTVAGTTIYGDITSDGTSFGRAGSSPLGGALRFDNAVIVFPIIAKDFTISYEYQISAGGKHWVQLMAADSDVDARFVAFGSWSPDFSNTEGVVMAAYNQSANSCQAEQEPSELAGQLPQTSGVWRTRTLVKAERTVIFTDGATGPIPVTRCYFPVRGHVAMNLGPGVRVRNLSVS